MLPMFNPLAMILGSCGALVIGSFVFVALYLTFFPVLREGVRGLGQIRLTREAIGDI